MPGPAVRLGDGTELIGPYQGSGRTEAPCLVRRGDGRLFEVSPLLYLVASELDGTRDLDFVARRVSDRLGRAVSAESMEYLVERKLRPLGILTSPPTSAAPARAKPLLGMTVGAAVLPARLVGTIAGVCARCSHP